MITATLKTHLKIWGVLFPLLFIPSCKAPVVPPSNAELKESKENINHMAMRMEIDISKSGPIAWLDYFEDSPDFFMASNGTLVFKDYQSARQFITTKLVKAISKITLKWSNLKVEPYTNEWGSFSADFNENLADQLGKTISINGYFTATAHKTAKGWKLRSVHWSIKPA
jgi:hypothetical protein